MKKGKKYYAHIHKVFTVFRSGFMTSAIGFAILSAVSLSSIIVNFVALGKGEIEGVKDIGNLVISCISFVISLFGTVNSIKTLFRNSFRRQFLIQKDFEADIKAKVGKNINEEYKENGYEWCEYGEQRYLHSKTVNEKLDERAGKAYIRVSGKKQPLSSDQNEALYKIVTDKIAAGKSIFNSNLVRLRTDMLLTAGALSENNRLKTDMKDKKAKNFRKLEFVELEKTDYFYNLATNDQIYHRLFKFDYSSVYNGRDMTVDKTDTLYNLSVSPGANIVGVSTLAITRDGFIIANKQNNNNDVNNNCFVPSGSGSSDFDDLKCCYNLCGGAEADEVLKKIVKYYDKKKLRARQKDMKKFLSASLEGKEYTAEIPFYDENEDEKPDGVDAAEEETTLNGRINKRIRVFTQTKNNKTNAREVERYMRKMRKKVCNFKQFLTYGMVRELIEESHICELNKNITQKSAADIKKYMDNTYVCGYVRLLDRGGKPDFFGLTLLDLTREEVDKRFLEGKARVTKTEVKRGCSVTDFNEVCGQRFIDIYDFERCEKFEDLLKEKDNKDKEVKLSLQLYYLFELLKSNPQILEKAKANAEEYRRKTEAKQ